MYVKQANEIVTQEDSAYKASTLGGVAQLARACGSYPQCPRFESVRRHHLKLM